MTHLVAGRGCGSRQTPLVKRPFTSVAWRTSQRMRGRVPSDERSESKNVNSAVELEARESRADCFRHLKESPLSYWKGVVLKSDIAFFQEGVTDAQRVSTFIHSLISVGLFLTLAFVITGVRESRAE